MDTSGDYDDSDEMGGTGVFRNGRYQILQAKQDATEKIIELCKRVITCADEDRPVTIRGNDCNPSEVAPMARQILEWLGVEE